MCGKRFRRIGLVSAAVPVGGAGYNLHTGLLEITGYGSPAFTCCHIAHLVMDMYEHSYQMDYGAAAQAMWTHFSQHPVGYCRFSPGKSAPDADTGSSLIRLCR